MFFKRNAPKSSTFDERLRNAAAAGFQLETAGPGKARVSRGRCAAYVHEHAPGDIRLETPGLAAGDEIALLTDAGYQKFFLTPSGVRFAAAAQHLRELHDFTEDLREALGLTSLYNEGLGTVNELHIYDRLAGRR